MTNIAHALGERKPSLALCEAVVALAVGAHRLAVALDERLKSLASGRLRSAALAMVLEARCARAGAVVGRLRP
jgi:hypothetical protein